MLYLQLGTRLEREKDKQERKERNEAEQAGVEMVQNWVIEETEEEEEGEAENQVVMTHGVPAVTLTLRVQTQGTGYITTAATYTDRRVLIKERCRFSWTKWKPYSASEQRAVGAKGYFLRHHSPVILKDRPKIWTDSYASVRMSSS
jgi:hypothetical protein